jgi:hypothetical protein
MNQTDGFQPRNAPRQLADAGALIGLAVAHLRQSLQFATRFRQQQFQTRDLALSGDVDVAQALQSASHRSLPGVSGRQ